MSEQHYDRNPPFERAIFLRKSSGALIDVTASVDQERAELRRYQDANPYDTAEELIDALTALRAERDHYEGVVTSIVNALELPTGADVVAEVERMRPVVEAAMRHEQDCTPERCACGMDMAAHEFRAAQQETTDANEGATHE